MLWIDPKKSRTVLCQRWKRWHLAVETLLAGVWWQGKQGESIRKRCTPAWSPSELIVNVSEPIAPFVSGRLVGNLEHDYRAWQLCSDLFGVFARYPIGQTRFGNGYERCHNSDIRIWDWPSVTPRASSRYCLWYEHVVSRCKPWRSNKIAVSPRGPLRIRSPVDTQSTIRLPIASTYDAWCVVIE